MRLLSTIKVALRALRRNTMRSILTALGIIIGVAAVIAMVSIGNGAKAQVEAQVASLGENIVTVFPGSFNAGGMRSGWGGASTLTVDDADGIRREVPNVLGVSPEMRDRRRCSPMALTGTPRSWASPPTIRLIRNWPMAEGAMFTDQDVRSAGKVCRARKDRGRPALPGRRPRSARPSASAIFRSRWSVCLPQRAFNLFGQDQDDTVVIPYTSP